MAKTSRPLPPRRFARGRSGPAPAARLRRTEQALAESEARFRDFAAAAGDWLWETDTRDRFTWISDSVEGKRGRPPSYYVGKSRTEIALAAGVDLRSATWRAQVQAIAHREPFRLTPHRLHGPAGDIWVSVRGVPRFDAAGRFLGYRGAVSDVTAEVENERRARTAEERLRAGLEHLRELIVLTDADDRIVVANHRFVEFNAAVAEHVAPGKRYDEHLRAGMACGLFPDALGREEQWLAERMAVRRDPGGPVERRRQDGRWLQVEDHRLPDGGTISFGIEVTERKRAEEVLRESEQRFRAIYEQAAVGIAIHGLDGRWLQVNQKLCDILGYSREELLERTSVEITPADKRNKAEDYNERIRRGELRTYSREKRYVHKDGRLVHVTLTVSVVLGADGKPSHLISVVEDITERKRANAALREQTERVKLGQALSRMLTVEWDIGADRLLWSDSPEWLLGPAPAGSYPLFKDLVHPDDREAFLAQRACAIASTEAVTARFRIVRSDGEVRWLQAREKTYAEEPGRPRHMLIALQDITERVRSEELARSADERLRAAVENLSEAIALTDSEDRIVFVNRRARELNAGVQAYLEPGRRYEDFLRALVAAGDVPEAAGREAQWLAERLAKRREPASAFEQKRQEGIWQLVSDQRLPDGGTITIGLEITERKRAEEALRNANAELERRVAARTAELKAAYQELESFSYSVSHDLRAPLRAISGFSNILRDEEAERLSEEGRRYLAVIDDNARRMGKLVDALLELVRLSRQALERAPLDMAAIARSVCAEFSGEYPRARIEVGSMPPAAGDATLIRQVYANLIGNALKYSCKVESPRVEIGAEDSADGSAYFVRDNGAGFDMTYGDKLFKPFERLHTDPEYQGTGIGLALVHLIIQRHGGTIRAEGAPGKGASFLFTLGNGAAAG